MDATKLYLIKAPMTPVVVQKLTDKVNERLAQAAAQGHPLGRFHCPDGVQAAIQKSNENGLLAVWFTYDGELAGYLMASVGQPWWSTEKVLIEESVMLFKDDVKGFGRVAAACLENLARGNGCAMIHTGNILCPDDALVKNLYLRKSGFQLTYPMFVKVLD